MTVAVFVKVFDGMVLATDSATTIQLPGGGAQVYNNADKIFHLHRELPVAAMTWGLGQIGAASISTLAKDLRRRFMGLDKARPDWKLNPEDYSVETVARKTAEMLQSCLADSFDGESKPPGPVGMLVAGFSSDCKQSEAWQFFVEDLENSPEPTLVANQDASGWQSYAQPDAINRLFRGFDDKLISELHDAVPEEHHEAVLKVLVEQQKQPVIPSMPFPDAIALAKFLVEVTAGYSHFLLGPDTVGGPVEVAAVNRHEGFKWISRKHYYSTDLNRGASE